MQINQKDMVISLIGSRAASDSTEAFMSIADADQPILFLDLWNRGAGRIGFAELHLCGSEARTLGRSAGLYELTQLHPAGYQVPGPIVSLTGVLWPRREVLEQLEAGDASLPLAGLKTLSSRR